MIRKSIAAVFEFIVVAFLLFAFLFAGDTRLYPQWLHSVANEFTAVFRDPATQWMAVFCLTSYFVTCLLLKRRASSGARYLDCSNPNLWLGILVFLAVGRYALAYDTASLSAQVPTLLAGIVLGKGLSLWIAGRLRIWGRRNLELQPPFCPPGKDSAMHSIKSERLAARRTMGTIFIFLALLAGVALWRPQAPAVFQYRGVPRWSLGWDNPNLCGLLMGTGCVLALGMVVFTWKKRLVALLSSFALFLCICGLFKSYSRGAWLGAACGVVYLAITVATAENRAREVEMRTKGQNLPRFSFAGWLNRNWLWLAVIALSAILSVFWQFRFTEWRAAQRMVSVANADDFSWRNRVAAWESAMQMMAEKPWFGFGWNQPESAYQHYYLQSNLTESAAIKINDYSMLGATLGLPALFCFGTCLWLSLTQKSGRKDLAPEIGDGHAYPSLNFLKTVCRAGAIVLAVGFFLDGGLFHLPTGSVFFILFDLAGD